MTEHSYLVTWNGDPAAGPDRSVMRALKSADGVPLVFKILVSQDPALTEVGTAPGSQLISPTGTLMRPLVGVTGSLGAGRAKLVKFLDALVWRGLFNTEELNRRSADLMTALTGPASEDEWVTLGIDSASGAGINPLVGREAAQAVLSEVADIDSTISRAMSELVRLKADGRAEQMWETLGLAKGRQPVFQRPEYENPPPSGVPAAPKPPLNPAVVRPGGVTAVCVISIVAGSLGALGSLAVIGLAGSSTSPVAGTAGGLGFLMLVIFVLNIFLAAMVLRGSSTARRVFAILVGIGIGVDVLSLVMGQGSIGTFINLILSVVYLVVLYSESANEYFAYVASQRGGG